ncbi:MAG: 4Fe-4S dicluster domain-containing protein [Bacillota bacterium]
MLPVDGCYQCQKCTAGCPVAPWTDIGPARLVELLLNGQEQEALRSNRLWLCLHCGTCAARCPNGIDAGEVTATLKQKAWLQKMVIPSPLPAFYQSFLTSVARWGRVYELGMILGYKWRTGRWLADLALGWQLLRQGNLRLLPQPIQGRSEVAALLQREGRA